jgi:hypothetical protein
VGAGDGGAIDAVLLDKLRAATSEQNARLPSTPTMHAKRGGDGGGGGGEEAAPGPSPLAIDPPALARESAAEGGESKGDAESKANA